MKSKAQYFEGEITYKTTIVASDYLFVMMFDTLHILEVKGNKVRQENYGELPTNKYNITIGFSKYLIDTLNKTFEVYENPLNELDSFDIKFKRSKTLDETILNYNGNYYRTKDGKGRMEYWITDSIIPHVKGGGFLLKDKGIILKSHFKSIDKTFELKTEAISINFKSIDSSIFEIPLGYKQQKSRLRDIMIDYGVDETLISKEKKDQK